MSEELVADAVGIDFVPSARPTVVSVPVEAETVLYDQQWRRLHRLDAIAAVVWDNMDGISTVHELSEDFAAAFSADPCVVEQDVLALVRDLGRKNLIDGVIAENGAAGHHIHDHDGGHQHQHHDESNTGSRPDGAAPTHLRRPKYIAVPPSG